MNLTLSGHDDRYAVEQLLLALFPENTPLEAVSSLHRGQVWITVRACITLEGKTAQAVRRLKLTEETIRLRRRALQQSVYLAARQLLDREPAWGALAGVRPTKITTKHLLEGGTPQSAERMLKDVYYVTPDRRKLAVACSQSTVKAVKLLEPEDISLYVGIPFCPTRCTYCSFVSRTVGRKTELLEPYLDALLKEIEVTGALLRKSGRRLRTIYIGGGTPSTLSTPQLERLMDAISGAFDLSRCLEFTVEGGRPDTLDETKLRSIRDHGANRMSINPQTMENSVLRACGRPHKAEDILRAYHQAAEAGFEAINMDLIAGLPEDTPEGFRRSLDECIALGANNITVHTLSLKKGSTILTEGLAIPPAEAVAEMLDYAAPTLRAAGYVPYYLYRQKYMSGSFENVGWCRPGGENLYNIYIMEELCSILSMGAGGSTKMVGPADRRITRAFNLKYPQEYIARPEKWRANQAEFAAFYE